MSKIKTAGAHHVRLTVTDVDRSVDFYTRVLGFELKARFGPNAAFLHDGSLGLGLCTPWHDLSDGERRFDEARVGLDHLGIKVASAEDVEAAAKHLDAEGVPHSGVKAGGMAGSALVTFRDPDNIQLEYYFSP
jgi:catechol 2,3-dioxygenase-like lactoylglutathione lyase family enzyme